MEIEPSKLIVVLILGLLVGPVAGAIAARKKQGFGWWPNLGIGLAGALIGILLNSLTGIDTFLKDIQASLQDLLATFIGCLIFLAGVWIYRRFRKRKAGAAPKPGS